MQSFLTKHQLTQETQPHYSPGLTLWDFWLLPKLKSPLKGKRFQTLNEIQENTMGQLLAIERTVWGPKVPTLKGTEVSLSYVQCLLCLVSSSINVSIFHITWLHTFWIDLVCVCVCVCVCDIPRAICTVSILLRIFYLKVLKKFRQYMLSISGYHMIIILS